MTRPNYDRSAIARTAAANIQTFISDAADLTAPGDIPLLAGTATARPDYDGPATLRTAAANIQTFISDAADLTAPGDIPLLVATTMTRPNNDWSAIARTTAANIQTFISYTTNLSGMAYIRESREQHSDQDCRPNSFRHGGLLNRNFLLCYGFRKMYTECPPLVLLFAHCSVSIGSGIPGRAVPFRT
jgi:hypothetical protein